MRPAEPRTPGRAAPALLLALMMASLGLAGCNGAFFYPNDRFYHHPDEFGLAHRDVWFHSADGTRLHGWFLPAQGEARATIVFFHGNAANVTNHVVAVRWLPPEGFHVLLFDYRGYGRSQGEPSRAGAIADGAAAIDHARRMPAVDANRLVVYGQSLGGALAINALAAAGTADVRALMLEGAFVDYPDAAQEVMQRSWLTWPFQPFAWAFVSEAPSPRAALPAISQVPALVVHRTGDGTVPFELGRKLYEALPNPDKTFWAVEGRGHIPTFVRPEPGWRPRLLRWLGERLPAAP